MELQKLRRRSNKLDRCFFLASCHLHLGNSQIVSPEKCKSTFDRTCNPCVSNLKASPNIHYNPELDTNI